MPEHPALPMYNVGHLIAALKKCPSDAYVILSTDSEGNSFTPLHSIEAGTSSEADQLYYLPFNPAYGDVVGAAEVTPNSHRCIILWPRN